MRYEISESITTDKEFREVMGEALSQFRKIARTTAIHNNEELIVRGIEATFGSINHKSLVVVSARKRADGWLLIADVKYTPSFWFWIFFLTGLFSAFFWIIPLGFYLAQKSSVREAIERCLARVGDEMRTPHAAPTASGHTQTAIGDLEKLASLKERGMITDEEFALQKRKLLGL